VQHHYEGHWKGWALKIETFLGPEMARAKRVPFGPKKVEGWGGLLAAVLCEKVFTDSGGGGWYSMYV
jgi:hypothetical protein